MKLGERSEEERRGVGEERLEMKGEERKRRGEEGLKRRIEGIGEWAKKKRYWK